MILAIPILTALHPLYALVVTQKGIKSAPRHTLRRLAKLHSMEECAKVGPLIRRMNAHKLHKLDIMAKISLLLIVAHLINQSNVRNLIQKAIRLAIMENRLFQTSKSITVNVPTTLIEI